jgi:hypothetical protein
MRLFSLLLYTFLVAAPTQSHADEKQELTKAISNASSVVLYSLEPGEKGARDSDGSCNGLCYFGWPVLGQINVPDISGKPFRNDLTAWVTAPKPEAVEMCFNPRHGIRIYADGHTYDFVVCFDCKQAKVFKDSAEEPFAYLFYNGSQRNWDKLLESGKVPLAGSADESGI